jgi:hypothetical protein
MGYRRLFDGDGLIIKYHGKTTDILRIHLQDFAENGADHAHFAYVHNLMTIPFVEHIIDVKAHIGNCFSGGKRKAHGLLSQMLHRWYGRKAKRKFQVPEDMQK